MKPFYQGKIDTFCALYAVLNALRITHGIRSLKARALFNDMLMELAQDTSSLQAVLEQTTDYVALVDKTLAHCAQSFPLRVECPFADKEDVSVDRFWNVCRQWMDADTNRTAIFRFKRFMNPGTPPIVRHWTTIEKISAEGLRLYDSSHEADAIQNLQKNGIVSREEDISSNVLLCVKPATLRLVGVPF